MDNRVFLGFVIAVIGLLLVDLVLGLGGTLTLARWLFAFIDWVAFWRYL